MHKKFIPDAKGLACARAFHEYVITRYFEPMFASQNKHFVKSQELAACTSTVAVFICAYDPFIHTSSFPQEGYPYLQ